MQQTEPRRFDVDSLAASIEHYTSLSADMQGRLVATLIIVLTLWFLRWVLLGLVRRRSTDVSSLYHWRRVTTYLTVFVGILLVGRVWFEAFDSIATFIGLIGAGIAIALRDPIANLAAWLFILWKRPFSVGDRIQIGTHAGDVIDAGLFHFTLLEIGNWVGADQSTGRIIHVPNGKVFIEPQANYTRGMTYIWNELPVYVTIESDWEKAKGLLLEIVDRHAHDVTEAAEKVRAASQQFALLYRTLTPTVYTSLAPDRGVLLTVRYLCEPRRRRVTECAIWEEILRTFAQHDDIAFAYPARRNYNA